MEPKKSVEFALARRHYSRPTVDELLREMENENSTSFIVARNPMERLGIQVSLCEVSFLTNLESNAKTINFGQK